MIEGNDRERGNGYGGSRWLVHRDYLTLMNGMRRENLDRLRSAFQTRSKGPRRPLENILKPTPRNKIAFFSFLKPADKLHRRGSKRNARPLPVISGWRRSAAGRPACRSAAIPGPRNGIAPGVEQRRDRGGMAFKRGKVQRGAAFALNPASVLPEEKVAPKTGGFDSTAFVHRIEGVAFLILSGKFIGYLPVHYAAGWVDAGCMRSILPGGCKPKSKSRRGPVLSPIAH